MEQKPFFHGQKKAGDILKEYPTGYDFEKAVKQKKLVGWSTHSLANAKHRFNDRFFEKKPLAGFNPNDQYGMPFEVRDKPGSPKKTFVEYIYYKLEDN